MTIETGGRVLIRQMGCEAQVHGSLPPAVLQELDRQMSFQHARAIWQPETLKHWDDGFIHLFRRRTQRFPSGHIPRVEHIISTFGIPVVRADERPPLPADPPITLTGELRTYQENMLQAALQQPYALIKAAPRSGKTHVAGAYIAARNVEPVLFLVNAIDLALQTREKLGELLSEPIGLIGDGVYKPERITVASVQSMHSTLRHLGVVKKRRKQGDATHMEERPLPNHHGAYDLLQGTQLRTIDECHHCTAPSHRDVYSHMPRCLYSLGLSATPWAEEDSAQNIQIEAAVGPLVCDVGYSELIGAGHLVPLFIEIARVPYDPAASHGAYPTVYSNYIVNNPLRNQIIVDFCLEMLADRHTVIVFVDRKAHGEHLTSEVPGAVFLHGGITGQARKDVWDGLRAARIPVVVATVGKEGMDIPSCGAMVMGCSGHSAIKALQAVPRVLTAAPGKTHAHALDFYDRADYLQEHSDARIEMYESESAFQLRVREEV